MFALDLSIEDKCSTWNLQISVETQHYELTYLYKPSHLSFCETGLDLVHAWVDGLAVEEKRFIPYFLERGIFI